MACYNVTLLKEINDCPVRETRTGVTSFLRLRSGWRACRTMLAVPADRQAIMHEVFDERKDAEADGDGKEFRAPKDHNLKDHGRFRHQLVLPHPPGMYVHLGKEKPREAECGERRLDRDKRPDRLHGACPQPEVERRLYRATGDEEKREYEYLVGRRVEERADIRLCAERPREHAIQPVRPGSEREESRCGPDEPLREEIRDDGRERDAERCDHTRRPWHERTFNLASSHERTSLEKCEDCALYKRKDGPRQWNRLSALPFDDLVHHAVLLGFPRGEEKVAVGVLFDLRKRLARVLREDLVQAVLHADDVLCGYLHLHRLAFRAAHHLVEQHLGVRA